MPIEHINKTDTLNKGREKLNEAIDGANAADVTSKAADTKATQALANSESTQTQLDTIVIDGDSSVEAAQARVDEKGVPHPTLKARIDDGLNSVNQQLAEIPKLGVSVTEFGAVGDNVADDRQSIQNAIDYLESRGGGTLFFPYTKNGYSIRSTNPDYPESGLVIKSDNIKLTSINHTQIWAATSMHSLIQFPPTSYGFHSISLENIRLEGSQLAEIGIYSEVFIYRASFTNLYVHNFIKKGMEANVFTAKFDRCVFRKNTEVGVDLNDLDMPGTSVVFLDTNCSENETGYKLTYVNYSSFISSFGEYSNLVFDLDRCNTVSFTSCGAEHINQVLRVRRGSGIEFNAFYLGEMGFNGGLANPFIFDFQNVSSCHFGGTNRQETLQTQSRMLRFLDCKDVTMKYGRIHKFRNQVAFTRTQVTVLDEVKRSTVDMTYFIDPVNGSDYADFDNHGTSEDSAFKSWRKVMSVIPKNIDHNIQISIMGDLDEVLNLDGFVISSQLYVSGSDFTVKSLDINGSIGNLNINALNLSETSEVRHSQGIRLTNLSYDKLNIRYSSGILVESNKVKIELLVQDASTVRSVDNTGGGAILANGGLVFVSGTEPTGNTRARGGGRIFRQE